MGHTGVTFVMCIGYSFIVELLYVIKLVPVILYEEIVFVYKAACVQLIYLTKVVIAHWSEGLIIKVWMYPGNVSL